MYDINLADYANQAASAVQAYRDNTNTHWSDSYLNMGAQLAQQAMENDYSLKLWNLNNAYNTPEAQMQRFKEAGLNPNLIYQQGTPGNSSSPAQSSHASYEVSPNKDIGTILQNTNSVVQMFTNLLGNINSVVNQSYDTALKRNELAWSNTELSAAQRFINNFGSRNKMPSYKVTEVQGPDGSTVPHFATTLNPFSNDFSPLEYSTLSKLGKIPQYFTGYLSKDATANLTHARARFQNYYNVNLLPKLLDYQQSKIDINEVQKDLLTYQREALLAMPPELRGILQPLMQFFMPMLRFGLTYGR